MKSSNDDSRKTTTTGLSTAEAARGPLPRKLVVAALIVAEGKLLLSQRRPDQHLPLCWEFPGGKVEPGEPPERALVREIREELGCTVTVQRIEEVVHFLYDAFELVMLVYRCSLTAGEPRPVQVADVRWVEPQELLQLDLPPADRPLAARLAAEGVLWR